MSPQELAKTFAEQNQSIGIAKFGLQHTVARDRDITLADKLDERIAILEKQVADLKSVKNKLSEPGGLLNIPLDLLRYAMYD
jgi:hypothetical protein